MFHIVVAYDQNQGIGYRNQLPWKFKKDLVWFKNLTTQGRSQNGLPNCVIMGRNTWKSIPTKFRPLPQRLNLVLSRRQNVGRDALADEDDFPSSYSVFFSCFDDALNYGKNNGSNVFVIGGEQIYNTVLSHPELQSIYATEIASDYLTDRSFPEFKSLFPRRKELHREEELGVSLCFCQYSKR